jgi:iron(III) transport system ATP-binding protein
MSSALLQLDRVSKRYPRGEYPAVDEVSISVPGGSFTALVGESGSGKTTLLRMVAGLEIPDTGRILLGTRLLFEGGVNLPPERRGVGLVFQHHALFPHLTVGENIAFGLRGQPTVARRRAVGKMLELIHLPGHEGRHPHELSGGERQRVALARALAPEPEILLLDEPFSNLDASLKNKVRDEVKQILSDAGATVLFVTHDTKDALAIADQIAVLREGRLQQVGAPQHIYHAPTNRYVANFFGACNFLPFGAFGDLHQARVQCLIAPGQQAGSEPSGYWIRPEDLELAQADLAAAHGGVVGTVKRVTFCGEYREMVVGATMREGSEIDLVVYWGHSGAYREGDRVGIIPRSR